MASQAEAGSLSGGPGYRAQAPTLKPAITRRMLLFFIVGDILGGGIYALVGEVGAEIGGAIWVAFAVAGIVAAFTAASYAELVSKFPSAGGAALFVHSAFRTPLFTFLVAFAVMCSGVSSAATLATAFGGDYLSEFIDLPTVLVGLVVVAALVAAQLPRDQGVGHLQHGLHADRARRPAARGRHRPLVPLRRRRRHRRAPSSSRPARRRSCSRSPARRSRSTP